LKRIGAVILAAGASTRFGQPKQLLDWDGVPLLVHVVDVVVAAGLGPVIVVLGYLAKSVQAALDAAAGQRGWVSMQTMMNWRWEEGMSTSVQVGLSALPPETEGAVFLQCDQPLITSDLLRSLVARFEETNASIVHPTHAGQRGTPVLFSRRLFGELAAVTGDEGGRSLITRHARDVAAVQVTDPTVLADIDTPGEYERLRNSKAARSTTISPHLSRRFLAGIRHLIIDMDGVLWRGDTPMDGLQAFFAFLRQRHVDFVLATNNASRTPEQYADKLARLGVEVPTERILTSALVAAAYLATLAPPGSRVYAIGEDGARRALEQQGFVLSDGIDDGAEYVVVGWDRELTWNKLATAALLVHAGATFIGTNPDLNFPTELGPVPGNGAQLAAIEVTTGVSPIVVGKPEPWMYQEAMGRLGARPETTAVLGDRLDTDIAGGIRAGLSTILVLSGIATEADLVSSPVRPDLVCKDIEELVQVWTDQPRQ
jgi:4-nitrophenyl phosphatase